MLNDSGSVYLSVVIPAYNEESRIEKTVRAIFSYLSRQPYSSEVIVVSDDSKDNTAIIVKKLSGEFPKLFLIDRKENRGKGYSVREGMLKANGKIRLFTDADNSTDISHFDKMRPLFDKGYDIVIASRHSWDAEGARQAVSQPFLKRISGILGNLFIQVVAVRGLWDTQCGFKAFRDYAALKIFSQIKIYRWGFDIEVLAIARRLNYKIGIIPAHWINDPHSKVKLSGYFMVLFEALKIKFNLLRGVYK